MQNVSIILPAYNAADTIARAVRSALVESEVAEVIVIDDASTDGTINAARTADDGSNRLKILSQAKNAGPAAARNRGITESSGEWIGILDADDFFLPGRIKALLTLADRADFIADDAGRASEDNIGGPRQSLLNDIVTAPRLIAFAEFVPWNITNPKRSRGEIGFIKPIMRRAFLDAHNLRYQEHMRLGEDYELYARALALGARFYLIPNQGYVSVIRKNSLSGQHSEIDLLHLRDCDDDLAQLPGLSDADKAALWQHYLSVDCRLQWRLLINAVKQRDARGSLATFMRPWPVPFYLAGQLAEQVVVRASKKLKGRNG